MAQDHLRHRTSNRKQENEDTTTSDTRTPTTCNECGGNLVKDQDSHGLVCQDCGLIHGEKEASIDHGPEWRSYDEDDKPTRASPVDKAHHDKLLGSTMAQTSRDGRGNTLSSEKRRQLHRLRQRDKRAQTTDSADRSLRTGITEIHRMTSALGIPDETDNLANQIYRKVVKDELLPGRSIEAMSSAAVGLAVRINELGYGFKDIAHVSRVERRPIIRAARYIQRELNLGIRPPDPSDHINKIFSSLDISSSQTRQLGHRIITKAKEHDVHIGKDPAALAGAVVYYTTRFTGERVTQGSVADACNTNPVTLRQHISEIESAATRDWLFGIEP